MRTLLLLALAANIFIIGSSARAAACAGFNDVDTSDSYCSAVKYLKDRSITLGCTATAYCPDAFVSRAQMALFLERLGHGGADNQVTDWTDTVGGGESNQALGTGNHGVVGGGLGNSSFDPYSVVGGGYYNVSSGISSTVSGGSTNTASGSFSTVAGGAGNAATGAKSFAAGTNAKATTDGSFIWADSRNFDFGPSVDNFFGVRATGGIGLTVAIDPNTGSVTQFCNLLPGTPSWQCTSDRNAKENLVRADGADVLRRLVAMPLYSYNFKGSDPAIRSLGPMAQDFYATFGLGRDNKMLASINLEGVALAAVQGLNAKLEASEARIAAQARELAEIKAQLAAISGAH